MHIFYLLRWFVCCSVMSGKCIAMSARHNEEMMVLCSFVVLPRKILKVSMFTTIHPTVL